jgi:hypothetical protein
MVKTPFIVAGVVIAVLLAAIAYFEFRPQPTVVAPAPTVAALPPAPPQPTPLAPPAPQTAADCLLPGPPPVPPDGGSATAADMKLEHDVFQSFVLQLEGYQACREKQIAASGTGTTEQQKQTWRAQANAAIDEAQALAGAFAAQLKVYHKKHPEPLPQTPTK